MQLTIVRPSSKEAQDLLAPRLVQLQKAGFLVTYEDLPRDPSWPYAAAAAEVRANALQASLSRTQGLVLAARGGYGASDLLPLIDFAALERVRPHPWLIGFSDVSALHAAFYTLLGWRCIHGPMPATSLWRSSDLSADVEDLLDLMHSVGAGGSVKRSLPVESVDSRTSDLPISGPLFGGCFTVLTNLIGTKFFPKLAGHILFLEDTGESPARLMRAWNQWLQSGVLRGIKALVLGHFRDLGNNISDCPEFLYQEFQNRCPVPVFRSHFFGHTTPNHPLMLGAPTVVDGSQLTWVYDPQLTEV